jgi:two-component system response regulator DegU
LADDHALFREGLKRILSMESGFEVVGECSDGAQVLELCRQLKPDIILLDINMPEENGVTTTEKLRKELPDVKILILSFHDDESYVFETLRLGASGYLLKDMESGDLVNAIRAVASGYAYIHPKVTGKLINQMRRMSFLNETGVAAAYERADDGGSGGSVRFVATNTPLTKREAEVLRLMTEGKSNRAISEYLIISEKTVKNHVSSILQKMNVNDRTQAVLMAIKQGWVVI